MSFPAGIARFLSGGREKLLVAENLSDTAAIVDASSGKVEARIAVGERAAGAVGISLCGGRGREDARHGYISLWNSSEVVEIDLAGEKVSRRFALLKPERATDAGSHPTALLLSRTGKTLYVALANRDQIAAIDLASGGMKFAGTGAAGQPFAGSYPDRWH